MRGRELHPVVGTLASLLLALLVAASAGCASSKDLDTPRDRLGSLPCPGWFTFYDVADADRLGTHRYERDPRWFQPDESGHGILYTSRAGFLDIDHVRITIDTARYCSHEIRNAIWDGRDVVVLPTIEGSTFEVRLHDLNRKRLSEALANELAIRVGLRVAFLMMTWHEVLQWYGYRTVSFVDERPSAFSYDDPMSHVIGIQVAGRALRDSSGRSFDEAVTVALRAELKDLGVVTPEQTKLAVRAVEGKWWSDGRPLKRQLDVGMNAGGIHAWLVPNLPFTGGAPGISFKLPTLNDLDGRDFSNSYSVRIDPKLRLGDAIRESVPGDPAFLAEQDFPAIIEGVRRQMKVQLAADVDQPWPVPAVAKSPFATQPRESLGDGSASGQLDGAGR